MAQDYNPFDYVNSINLKTADYTSDEGYMKHYPAFMVNKALSYFIDTIMHSNEMNRLGATLDKDMQYNFFIHSVRKSKRFSPWAKKSTNPDLDIVKQYYNYSTEKAEQALKLLSKEELQVIRSKLSVGGIK